MLWALINDNLISKHPSEHHVQGWQNDWPDKAVYEHLVKGRVVAKQLPDANCVIYMILLMIFYHVISKRCTFTQVQN